MKSIRLVSTPYTAADARARSQEIIFAPVMAGLPTGFASALSILPIHDANGELLQSLPHLGPDNPLMCAAVFPIDPFRRWPMMLDATALAGTNMVINWPSVGILDRKMRDELASVDLGYEREIEFVKYASDAGWNVTATVFNPNQAQRMMDAGCSRLLIHLPVSEVDGRIDYDDELHHVSTIKRIADGKAPILLYTEMSDITRLRNYFVDGIVCCSF